MTTADPRGPSTALGVCSSDRAGKPRTGERRHTFTVPHGSVLLRCFAYAAYRKGLSAFDGLDVFVVSEDGETVPKQVRTASGWAPAEALLPQLTGELPTPPLPGT